MACTFGYEALFMTVDTTDTLKRDVPVIRQTDIDTY